MRFLFQRLWFELVTPPLRSRCEARTMYPEFVDDDLPIAERRDRQFALWCERRSARRVWSGSARPNRAPQ